MSDVVALAEHAERLGIDAVSASDHPFPVVVPGSTGHHTFDPFVLLAQTAARTTRLQLVFSLLVAPYRNAYLTASMLATLADAAPGRVVVGLGAGYLEPEFEALGAAYDGRAGQVGATAAAMRTAWRGEPVGAAGNTLRPVPTESIRLWRGGNGPRAAREAAGLDGWMPFEAGTRIAAGSGTTRLRTDDLAERVAVYRETCGDRPGDVCFVRTSPSWLVDRPRAVDELGRLAQAGVSWVESGTPGRTPAEAKDDLERLAEVRAEAAVSS
ncbi:LLM class flavin-dependent oxidoreductase [Nocardioides mangrovicus]|uniref:LLM class flavin-dependent oxidoreductase n=2 Tax=Nocardioides mangrovicus TaxID=2478913 RepID=A0A3L8NXS9_9ACTN|nr:LLM class flavin-dependent oxidoreductase [Nocardioides mangrovicus]